MDIDIQDNKCVEMDEGEEIDYEPSEPEATNLFDDMQPDDIGMEVDQVKVCSLSSDWLRV